MLVTIASSLSGQTAPVAHVLHVQGNWYQVQQKFPLHPGDALDAGAKITTDSADFGNAITIVRDDDLSRQRVVCEDTQTNPCRKPILIVASPLQAPDVPKRNLSGLVNSALAALYKNNSKAAIQYFFKRSKGPSPVPQAEGVLEVNSHESDALAGILPGFPVGDYQFVIDSFEDSRPLPTQNVAVSAGGKWSGLQVAAPGLYAIAVIGQGGKRMADLMLLFEPKATFAQKYRAFEDAKSSTDLWEGEDARSDEHQFLQGLLDSFTKS
jgi:hypothetical protein